MCFYRKITSMSQGNHLETTVLVQRRDLSKMFPRLFLQRNELVHHKKSAAMPGQEPLGAADKLVRQIAINTETLIEGRVAEDKVECLLNLVSCVGTNYRSVDVVQVTVVACGEKRSGIVKGKQATPQGKILCHQRQVTISATQVQQTGAWTPHGAEHGRQRMNQKVPALINLV